jgi:aspartyl/asparaginyl beta-hydroxylase (cupin superfamily)
VKITMTDSTVERTEKIGRAYGALQRGNASQARDLFEQVVHTPDAAVSEWLGLAFACARLGDNEATLAAVDRVLELEPENIRGNIFKGDHLVHCGDSRGASHYYEIALRLAAQVTNIPDDVRQGLQRAQATCQRLDGEYRDFLMKELANDGFSPESSNSRFRQSLDILFGTSDIYYQQPRRYYYPGLPQIQFYEREDFDWVEALEAATDEIRSELVNVMSVTSRFTPYLESDGEHLSPRGTYLVNNDDWGAFYLWHYGELVAEAAELCPKAIAALEAAPQPYISGQSPIALFSKLRPRTRIPAHHGMINTRLICHLPLIIPEDCGVLRVGSEQRAWIEGEMLIFDDSIEHEAWNDSDRERFVLLFEIWRPELSEEERGLVSAVLAAVRRFRDG